MNNREYKVGVRAHNLAEYLGVEYGKAWQAAQCEAKRGFDTEREAREWGRQWGQRPYRCPVCKRWHNSNGNEDMGE